MRKHSLSLAVLGVSLGAFALPLVARAHEAYVLSPTDFQKGMAAGGPDPFDAFKNPDNVRTMVLASIGVTIVLVLNILARQTKLGHKFHHWIEKLEPYGTVAMRVSIGLSLFAGALTWNFLGPELTLHDLPMSAVLRWALFVSSGLIFAGLLTEVAAAAALIVFCVAFFKYGMYLATYLNYLGELAALLLFGPHRFSLDKLVFKARKHLPSLKKYEMSIVRISYGLGLIYAGITVKLLHPLITVLVVDQYDLTRFSHMFPKDPMMVVLGGGLGEIAVGLFILFGFQMRLAILVSLYYVTMSLIFFRELVWPHLLLYGISLYLLVVPEKMTIDDLIDHKLPWPRRKKQK